MKKYMIYWHVKDNPETYAHNDNMQLYAKSAEEARAESMEQDPL